MREGGESFNHSCTSTVCSNLSRSSVLAHLVSNCTSGLARLWYRTPLPTLSLSLPTSHPPLLHARRADTDLPPAPCYQSPSPNQALTGQPPQPGFPSALPQPRQLEVSLHDGVLVSYHFHPEPPSLELRGEERRCKPNAAPEPRTQNPTCSPRTQNPTQPQKLEARRRVRQHQHSDAQVRVLARGRRRTSRRSL